jgi:hypothetical protein
VHASCVFHLGKKKYVRYRVVCCRSLRDRCTIINLTNGKKAVFERLGVRLPYVKAMFVSNSGTRKTETYGFTYMETYGFTYDLRMITYDSAETYVETYKRRIDFRLDNIRLAIRAV